MRKNTKYDWIIAVSDSDGTGVELEKITETLMVQLSIC